MTRGRSPGHRWKPALFFFTRCRLHDTVTASMVPSRSSAPTRTRYRRSTAVRLGFVLLATVFTPASAHTESLQRPAPRIVNGVLSGAYPTTGALLRGVRYTRDGATTDSIVMRSRSGTVRRIEATHAFQKLEEISNLALR